MAKTLTAAMQIQLLRGRLAGFGGGVRLGRMTARGFVKPFPLSDTYLIRIEYQVGTHPSVWVEDPPLRPRSGEVRLPHMYRDGSICVYDSQLGRREWTADMQIAKTVLPWAIEWLGFYELWHATGIWGGTAAEHRCVKLRRGSADRNDSAAEIMSTP